MSPSAKIQRIDRVEPHPDNAMLNSPLDIVHVGEYVNVANRPKPDQPRYQVGDLVVVLTENLILPTWLLQHMGLWNEAKNKSELKGGRTRSRMVAKVLSEVALCKVTVRESIPSINEGGYQRRMFRVTLPGDTWTALLSEVKPDNDEQDDYDPTGMDMMTAMGIVPYVHPSEKTP